LKVLQVHTRYRQAGGEDAVVQTEGDLLRAAGHDVLVHGFDNPTSSREAAKDLIRAPWNRSAARRVTETAREFGADVVHVHNTWFALSPAVFTTVRQAGFPVVATVHNYRLSCVNALHYRDGSVCEDCVGRLPWRGVIHRCYRGSAAQSALVTVTIGTHRIAGTWQRDVDVIIALTSFAAARLVMAGVPPDRIVVKPNVVEDPGPRVNPASTSRRLLFVGRLTEDKGIMDLLDAWAKADSLDLELQIVGDGPLSSTIQSSAQSSVSMTGSISADEVRRLMLGARALVLPSRWFEGLPMVLVEALSCGLPVVVSDHGALPEIAGEAGVTFTAGDRRDLASVLSRLEDDALVDEKSAAALRTYRERFSPGTGVAQLENIYELAKTRQADGEESSSG
jgi:glycosyltransferase involved in cell wall biosynthesis